MRVNYNYVIVCVERQQGKENRFAVHWFVADGIDDARDMYWKVIPSFPVKGQDGVDNMYLLYNVKACRVM